MPSYHGSSICGDAKGHTFEGSLWYRTNTSSSQSLGSDVRATQASVDRQAPVSSRLVRNVTRATLLQIAALIQENAHANVVHANYASGLCKWIEAQLSCVHQDLFNLRYHII